MIDPLTSWAAHGEKPDFTGLLTFAGQRYTEDPAELVGVDVAIVGAATDDLVSDRPGTRFGPRAIRAAGCPPRRQLSIDIERGVSKVDSRIGMLAIHAGRQHLIAKRQGRLQ